MFLVPHNESLKAISLPHPAFCSISMPMPVCLRTMPQELHLWRFFEILRIGALFPSLQLGQAGKTRHGGAAYSAARRPGIPGESGH